MGLTHKSEKKFRISAKKMFLTYSQVHPEMTHDTVLECLKKEFNNFNYVLAKEDHKEEGGGVHLHAIITK